MKGRFNFLVALAACLGLGALFANTASATTFCIPDYFAGCPNNGVNTTIGAGTPGQKLETAMGTSAIDGVPDTIKLDVGTYADATSFELTGTDDLTIIGSGRDKSILTSLANTNIYVVNLDSGNSRHITMKDLAIVIPESFPDAGGYGAAIQTKDDDFESVDVINENPGGPYSSSGFANVTGGGNFKDVRVFGRNGARVGTAFATHGCTAGEITIEDSSFESSIDGLEAKCPNQPITMNRVTFSGVDRPIAVGYGAKVDATNLLIEGGDSYPVSVYNIGTVDEAVLNLDHATIVASGNSALPALSARVYENVNSIGDVTINVSNSIIAGFDKTWDLKAPTNAARGDVALNVRYSSFTPLGDIDGDATFTPIAGNISGNPGFAGITDFRLAANSPAIDAGDPGAAEPKVDLGGNLRPVDGNGDGKAVRDMGAYERDKATCATHPVLCPLPTTADKVAPKVTKIKFRFKPGRGGSLRFKVSEAATIRVVFKPLGKKARAKSKRRKAVRFKRTAKKAGMVRIKLRKGKLKPGRYQLKITAVDAAKNRMPAKKRKVKVQAAR